MKTRTLLFMSLATLLVGNSCLSFSRAIVPELGVINVKDYGAKGDGHTDDTKAIQAAITAATNAGYSTMQINPGDITNIYFGGSKKIYFPFGTYRISHTISFGTYLNIGADQAILEPTPDFRVSNQFAFSGNGWQLIIKGLQFIGFSKALQINNQNANAGRIILQNCDFINNGIAISLEAQSSISVIENCRFINDQKVLKQVGDKVILRDSWISSGTLTGNHDAQIVVYGTLHLEDDLLVPTPPATGAIEPAWINNYGSVWASGIRQGAEPGSFTLINNFARATSTFLNGSQVVSVQNSSCYAVYGTSANNPTPAVLRLFNIPNQIILENLSGLVNASLMDFSHSLSIYSEESLNNKNCSIKIGNIVGGYATGPDNLVPTPLRKFIVK